MKTVEERVKQAQDSDKLGHWVDGEANERIRRSSDKVAERAKMVQIEHSNDQARRAFQKSLEHSKNLLGAYLTGNEARWKSSVENLPEADRIELRVALEGFGVMLIESLSPEGHAEVEKRLGGEPPTKIYTIDPPPDKAITKELQPEVVVIGQ
jgi:hypothetical protein